MTGCAGWSPLPWWKHETLWAFAAAGAAGTWSTLVDVPALVASLGMLAAGAVAAVAAVAVRRLTAPVHAHCDGCEACSVAAGLPAGRTGAVLDGVLVEAGWTVAGRVTRCPGCGAG